MEVLSDNILCKKISYSSLKNQIITPTATGKWYQWTTKQAENVNQFSAKRQLLLHDVKNTNISLGHNRKRNSLRRSVVRKL